MNASRALSASFTLVLVAALFGCKKAQEQPAETPSGLNMPAPVPLPVAFKPGIGGIVIDDKVPAFETPNSTSPIVILNTGDAVVNEEETFSTVTLFRASLDGQKFWVARDKVILETDGVLSKYLESTWPVSVNSDPFAILDSPDFYQRMRKNPRAQARKLAARRVPYRVNTDAERMQVLPDFLNDSDPEVRSLAAEAVQIQICSRKDNVRDQLKSLLKPLEDHVAKHPSAEESAAVSRIVDCVSGKE
jgi:hypothetical protein